MDLMPSRVLNPAGIDAGQVENLARRPKGDAEMLRFLAIAFLTTLSVLPSFAQDSLNVERLAIIDSLERPGRLILSGELLYLVQDSSLRVLDVQNPSDPRQISIFRPGRTQYLALRDTLGFLGCRDSTLTVLDTRDPADLRPIGQLFTRGFIHGISLKDSLLYVVMYDWLEIVDVRDPENPVEAAYYYMHPGGFSVYIYRDLAFVSTVFSGISVLDLSDPLNPFQISSIPTPGHGWWLTCQDDYLYLADYNQGLKVFDIIDPVHPEQIGRYDPGGRVFDVAISEDLAYIAAGEDGLRVIDVGIPGDYEEVGYYDTPGQADCLVLGDSGLVFLSDHTNLGIYRYKGPGAVNDKYSPLPLQFALHPAFPNPFNARTVVSFSLPSPMTVSLQAFNAQGAKVARLSEGWEPAGNHQLIWDASWLPAGVYLLKMEGNGLSATQSAVVVK